MNTKIMRRFHNCQYQLLNASPMDSGHTLLEIGRDKRGNWKRKCHKCLKVNKKVDIILVTCTMGLGVAGVALLSKTIAALSEIAKEEAALGTRIYSILKTN